MKKALIISSVYCFIESFELNNIKLLLDLGYDVHVISNIYDMKTKQKYNIDNLEKLCVHIHYMTTTRNPISLGNIKAYNKIKKIIKKENINLIHCHTPVGGALARLAARKFKKKKIKVIYTAHGFHFYKGNKTYKNFIFRTIEKKLARYTDVLITINKEDYNATKGFKLKDNGFATLIPGVGIDIKKINSIKAKPRVFFREIGIPDDAIILLSVGELNKNKNHQIVINAMKELEENFHYIICGIGEEKENLDNLILNLNLSQRVHLLGQRDDVISLMKSSNMFIFPSFREGLSVALMEAISCGLPVVASKIRGNSDLIDSIKIGILVNINDKNEYAKSIKLLNGLCQKKENENQYLNKYSVDVVNDKMLNIYNNI